MNHKIIECNSVVKTITKKDSLFHGDYCIDPYQNCEFGCRYCDSSLDKTIYVKSNIEDVLSKELKQLKVGRIIIGSVHDPYQNAEEKYELTKVVLQALQRFSYPCHILTKSPLILRDIDLLAQLDCMVTVSISSLQDAVVHIFEPNVPSPAIRLDLVQSLQKKGIKTGIALIPLLPYIVESELKTIFKAACKVNAQYFLYKHLELKGDQKQLFMKLIASYYPSLLAKYNKLYKNNFSPQKKYIEELTTIIEECCQKYKLSCLPGP